MSKCPICDRPTDKRFRPFCSARCADVDLGRWLKGAYRVPGPPLEAEEDPVEPTPPARDPEDDEPPRH